MNNVRMKKIEITSHARQRMAERMPEVKPCDYDKIAKAARYEGITQYQLSQTNPRLAKSIFQRFHWNNSTQVRIYKDHAFIFCGNKGHSRTLRTVIDIPKHIIDLLNT